MSERAAVCPHCAARQSGRDPVQPKPAAKPLTGLTREETAALLAVHGVDRPRDGGGHRGMTAVLLPHPRAVGMWRVADLTFMALALPTVLCGLLHLLVMFRLANGLRRGTSLGAHLGTAALGALGLFSIGSYVFGLSMLATLVLVGVSSGALVARAILHAVLE